MKFDSYEFTIAGTYASYLINGDASGLDMDELTAIAKLIQRIPEERRRRGHWEGFSDEDAVGFTTDEVSGLRADCYKVRWHFPIVKTPALATLRKRAQQSTKFRGHSMRWGAPYGNATTQCFSQRGTCKRCGMSVVLNTHPAPNGIDVGGEAVALNCK